MYYLKAKSYHLKAIPGFTLIELLIVIAIIAILAGVVFVSLNPLKRFQDARNASRWTDTTAVLSAIKVDQVDNGGAYLTSVTGLTAGTNYMIGTAVTGCNVAACTQVVASANCVDLAGLSTEGYLARVPVSPAGVGTWTDSLTGYYLSRNTNGSITVGACDAEDGETITVNR
ncbi:MAG TPA: prepilin-type N-terminal cleavage/methylation domain-containing protein [Candidatus Paceibacterota bacterium]